jgi:hypothetical protein
MYFILTSLFSLSCLSAAAALAPQNFADLPFDDENRLVGNWVLFKKANSDTNLCQDEVFLNPNNWLHGDTVNGLFNFAHMTEQDYQLVIQNEIGECSVVLYANFMTFTSHLW